jgi:hypothetical protein
MLKLYASYVVSIGCSYSLTIGQKRRVDARGLCICPIPLLLSYNKRYNLINIYIKRKIEVAYFMTLQCVFARKQF